MEYFCIDFAKEFHCLAGECPQSCCKGWHIPVDDETYSRYLLLSGVKGRSYRSHIIKKDPKRIKKILFRCPFHTSKGLCLHQACGEELLMPIICRNYPRRIIDFGDFMETTMELSCPEAARLFVENIRKHKFIPMSTKQKSVWDVENDDKDFLQFLLDTRNEIIDYVWEDGNLGLKWEAIFAFVYNMHDLLARDRLEDAKNIELTEDKLKQGAHALYNKGYSFYPISVIDRMLLEHIDYGGLILRVPRFYAFIKRYNKIFSKKQIDEADKYFTEKVNEMLKGNPNLEKKYKAYFCYVLQQEFLLSYESYSMIRELMLCILYTELLMLFDLTEYIKVGKITKEREQEILFLAEHNIRHNPSLTKNLYNVIREEIL